MQTKLFFKKDSGYGMVLCRSKFDRNQILIYWLYKLVSNFSVPQFIKQIIDLSNSF